MNGTDDVIVWVDISVFLVLETCVTQVSEAVAKG